MPEPCEGKHTSMCAGQDTWEAWPLTRGGGHAHGVGPLCAYGQVHPQLYLEYQRAFLDKRVAVHVSAGGQQQHIWQQRVDGGLFALQAWPGSDQMNVSKPRPAAKERGAIGPLEHDSAHTPLPRAVLKPK